MHIIAQCRTKKKPDMHKHCWIVSLIAFKRISFFFFFSDSTLDKCSFHINYGGKIFLA